MSVKSGRSIEPVAVGTSDTTIFETGNSESIKMSAFSGHSTAATVVTIYESPNLTSASGDIIDEITFAVGDVFDFSAAIGHAIKETKNVIAKATVVGCTVKMSFELYNGGDEDTV